MIVPIINAEIDAYLSLNKFSERKPITMSLHFYRTSTNLNIDRITAELTEHYMTQHFQTQHLVEPGLGFVQIRKQGVVRTALGFGKAITIRLQQVEGGLKAQASIEDWAEKLGAGALTILFLSIAGGAVLALVGSLEEIHFAHKVLDEVDRLVREQIPSIEIEHHEPKH
jgi:hypothetical protein